MMYLFSFLCGVAVTLLVETVVLMIATERMKQEMDGDGDG